VDLAVNPFHCGECFIECDSGICLDGECRDESAGHLVAIGHDYTTSNAMQRLVVGNAVFMGLESPVHVLAYEEFADTSVDGQVAKVDAAIDQVAAATGQSWEKTSAAAADDVADLVLAHAVLLIYTQASASDAELAVVGNSWFSALHEFLSVGGVIVFTDGPGINAGTWQILEEADLFGCSASYDASGSTAEVVEPGDSVAEGLGTSYLASANSVFFSTAEERVVVQDSGSGNPIVVHKVFVP
jgi:hypothetical protein